MNWDWASTLDHIWRAPTFPMWLALSAAGFFGIIVLITLLRAEKSVANGALSVITLLAIAVAVAVSIRGFGPPGGVSSAESRQQAPVGAGVPQLSCIDDLAGDADRKQCDDRQRTVGHGSIRAQHHDQDDEPEKSRRGQCQPHRKVR